jgi:hypothetical protein
MAKDSKEGYPHAHRYLTRFVEYKGDFGLGRGGSIVGNLVSDSVFFFAQSSRVGVEAR